MVVKGNVLHFQMEDRIYIEISNTNVITKKKKKNVTVMVGEYIT